MALISCKIKSIIVIGLHHHGVFLSHKAIVTDHWGALNESDCDGWMNGWIDGMHTERPLGWNGTLNLLGVCGGSANHCTLGLFVWTSQIF